MQSSRIAPVLRQIIRSTFNAKSATDSQSENRQEYREPERQPSKEDALEALEMLSQQEEFRKNALRAELLEDSGIFSIIVTDSHGARLKAIKGFDILRVIQEGGGIRKGRHLGRILDRRV